MSQSATPFRTAQQKEEERRTKRNAVLRAAVQMFNKQGFHATSLEDVATSLGITKPTIYHYLGNKDQVLLECLTIGLQQLLDAADIARSMPGTETSCPTSCGATATPKACGSAPPRR